MPSYRVYFLSADDIFIGGDVVEAGDDVTAYYKAKALAEAQGLDFEIWIGTRLVHRGGKGRSGPQMPGAKTG